MKIGIKQGIIIGAAVLSFGGLLVQGAMVTTNQQPVAAPISPVQTTMLRRTWPFALPG